MLEDNGVNPYIITLEYKVVNVQDVVDSIGIMFERQKLSKNGYKLTRSNFNNGDCMIGIYNFFAQLVLLVEITVSNGHPTVIKIKNNTHKDKFIRDFARDVGILD